MIDTGAITGKKAEEPVSYTHLGWINTDFMKTTSYTPNLVQYSRYYKTFSNILQIRTISAEYLVAMKLMSYREYKNDKSDIVGVLSLIHI